MFLRRLSNTAATRVATGVGLGLASQWSNLHSENRERVEAKIMIDSMQQYFVDSLESIKLPETGHNSKGMLGPVSWLRNNGENGGGTRFEILDTPLFNRASVNVSQVEYDNIQNCPVNSATALSVILHPRNPHAPSMHFHISLTEPRNGKSYWRIMADLNPSIPDANDKKRFDDLFGRMIPTPLIDISKEFGDRYFYIPVLKRHRGISHLFLGEVSEDTMSDTDSRQLAHDLAKNTIELYCKLVQEQVVNHPESTITPKERQDQIDYHTVYLLQVLTLDRGTTHGLLSHNENDVGTLGSIPNVVNRDLLVSWKSQLEEPQAALLQNIINELPNESNCLVDSDARQRLANVVRDHYKGNKKALALQADMDMKWWYEQVQDIHL